MVEEEAMGLVGSRLSKLWEGAFEVEGAMVGLVEVGCFCFGAASFFSAC